MRKHGSSEKTGFIEKELDFVKSLKAVQNYHIEMCIVLMKLSIFFLVLQWFFTWFCMIHFGCFFGSCENTLVCCIHYIKFIQAIVLINSYWGNIKERMPDHPIGIINSFLSILLYYACLYEYLDILNPDETADLVHFCSVYPILDLLLIIISFIVISKVKAKSKDLIENKRFKEY